MNEPRPADELAGFRHLLAQLEDGRLRLFKGGACVSQAEIDVLKREIAFLEKIIARNMAEG
jgi:hypothetical protein